MTHDIAIVGMSVEAPGARTPAAYWRIITSGASLTRPFPVERRKSLEEYIRYVRETAVEPILDADIDFYPGCYLDAVDRFDYAFFGMNPKQAALADPHQRMILRSMYLALEDAGYTGPRARGHRTGVFVGYANNPGSSYFEYLCRLDPALAQGALTGNIPAMMANRLSHFMDLRGPSLVVDTACSACLVAAHQAKNALAAGDCDIALVAGARIVLSPIRHPYSRIGIESSDGVTRTFDAAADGTGFGEGSGAVVLKRLADAVRDGDRVYAVIKGSAVNHDGTTEVMTNPDSDSQASLLRAAWRDSGVDPRDIGYIEAHGTATRIGDPIEYEGLRRAFAEHTSDKQFCAVGTVKANIGHLFEGSGVMGLIKAALMLKEGTIPPLANFSTPNPTIDFADGPLYVPTESRAWEPPAGGMRTCGVSAFGLGGTNAHMVLAEFTGDRPPAATPLPGPRLFTLSARNSDALDRLRRRYVEFIDEEHLSDEALEDVCYTANISRSAHPHRLAYTVSSFAELRARLSAERDAVETPAPQGDHVDPALAKCATAFLEGRGIEVDSLYPQRRPRVVTLPGYSFEESRCWIDFPDLWRSRLVAAAPEENHPVTHTVEFLPAPAPEPGDGALKVLALVDPATDAATVLSAASIDEVRYLRLAGEQDTAQEDADEFRVDAESFARIADMVLAEGFTHVVHALAFEHAAADNVAELDRRVRKNLHSLFLLAKALMEAGVKVTLVSLTSHAIAAHDGDCGAVTENAALVGFGKVITREYPYIKTKQVDIDRAVPGSLLRAELTCRDTGLFLLRGEQRLREVFCELPRIEPDGPAEFLKPGGTYLITGGTGALGLAVSRAFAAVRPDITLALMSRSATPPPEQWPAILAASETDTKLVDRVRTLQELVDRGVEVLLPRADVGDPEELARVVRDLRARNGRIDGIVHAAGVPGQSTIIFRDLGDFESVIRPKLHGAFMLDQLTRDERPDFIAHFSSVAAVFPAPGQGDYAAANYYLDNLARAARDDGCHTLALDWVAWREIGMAVDYGTNGDTTFKSLKTDAALAVLDAGLHSRRRRVFAGEVNYRGELIHLLSGYDVTLAPEIAKKVEDSIAALGERLRQAAERVKRTIEAVSVELIGRDGGGYTGTERKVAQCMAFSLGYAEIDIDADFFDMGGDSIMAASVANTLASCFETPYDVADLMADRTVAEIADHLDSSLSLQIGAFPGDAEALDLGIGM